MRDASKPLVFTVDQTHNAATVANMPLKYERYGKDGPIHVSGEVGNPTELHTFVFHLACSFLKESAKTQDGESSSNVVDTAELWEIISRLNEFTEHGSNGYDEAYFRIGKIQVRDESYFDKLLTGTKKFRDDTVYRWYPNTPDETSVYHNYSQASCGFNH